MRIVDMESGDPDEIRHLVYDLVVPRPIAWVSTRSQDGIDNLAPFSFYNAVSSAPPIVMVSFTHPHEGSPRSQKDTQTNILQTGEFVVHAISVAEQKAMIATSLTHAGDVDEFEFAGLGKAACAKVGVPRIAGASSAFECRLHEAHEIGDSTVVFGRVVMAHVEDRLFENARVATHRLDPLSRTSVKSYGRTMGLE